jgi:TatD DNase family protein
MIETHCHLDYLKDLPLPEILAKSKDEGVNKIITISVDPTNLDKVMAISKEHESVFCTQGIHPHDASTYDDTVEEKILTNATKNLKVVAIGEIGLDYHYNKSPKEKQLDAFKKQLKIAEHLKLPVVIHTRDAEADTEEILKNYRSTSVLIHSFTASLDFAKFSLSQNFFIGFNGIITFKNAKEVQEVVTHVPLEKIVLETDAPFLCPTPHRGKENAPYYLKFIAQKIAELKQVSIEQVIAQTTKNANELFNFTRQS